LECPLHIFRQTEAGMFKSIFSRYCSIILVLFSASSLAQAPQPDLPDDWFVRDPETDLVQGVSANRAYQTLLKDQPSRTIIVAVIDSGVDIFHEDLKDVVWINEDEIAGNGLDDDKNGYVDDVYGWNFIGGKDGNVNEDTYELTREYVRLRAKFESVENGKVGKKQRAEYEQYQKIKDKYTKLRDKNAQQTYKNLYANVTGSIDTLKVVLKTDTLSAEKLTQFNPGEPVLIFAKGMVMNMLKNMGPNGTLEDLTSQLKEGYDYYRVISEYGYNEDFNSRAIVGDDITNLSEKYYGNNDVKGPDAKHGTHVAGIIAANRKNDIGIKGIADNVRIMSVRTVPNGDERDKDIANAIYYAVDNGAQIINMSFGKSFSPQKEVVDKAVKYAEQKGVLLVHAAGNDADDNDEEKNFPNRFYLDGREAKNWLEIGASAWGTDNNFVGSFSNYGKKSVDLFAPGVMMYSTTPENQYEHLQGTSMAAPAVAGVAALIMSYFPELTPLEVKDILKKSTRQFAGLEVQKPGGRGKVKFSELSITGGLVNALEAVKLAQTYKGQKVVK
jgi:cell wall-associated protease